MDSFRRELGDEQRIILLMWITRGITARTLLWLAAITVPVQGLPAASCGCNGGTTCCKARQSQDCCCSAEKVREGRCCCACGEAESGHSCCSKAKKSNDSGCKCGMNCQCGQAKQSQPATPTPPENNSAEKIASDVATAVSVVAVYQPPVLPSGNERSVQLDAFTGRDRCISLCRFTL